MQATRRNQRLRRFWLRLQANYSIPSLLARHDERRVIAWATAIMGGISILIIGHLAWLMSLPLIFPALGPSVFILLTKPFSPDATPRTVLYGHLSGIGAGLIMRHAHADAVAWLPWATPEDAAMACAVAGALGLTALLMLWLDCPHPPACATGMLMVLAPHLGPLAVLTLIGGVCLITLQAVVLARIVGVQRPAWSVSNA